MFSANTGQLFHISEKQPGHTEEVVKNCNPVPPIYHARPQRSWRRDCSRLALDGFEMWLKRFQEFRIEVSAHKAFVLQNALLERNRCVDSFDHKHPERSPHALDRFGPIASVSDEFCD